MMSCWCRSRLSVGRKPKQKRDFFARAAELLAQDPGLRSQDLFLNLVEVAGKTGPSAKAKSQYTE